MGSGHHACGGLMSVWTSDFYRDRRPGKGALTAALSLGHRPMAAVFEHDPMFATPTRAGRHLLGEIPGMSR